MREINVAQTVLEGLTCMHAQIIDSMYHIFSPVLFLRMHERVKLQLENSLIKNTMNFTT